MKQGITDIIVICHSYPAVASTPTTPKRWERTQSEVYLKGRAPAVNIIDSAMLFNDNMSSESDDSMSEGKVSEHTKVRQFTMKTCTVRKCCSKD